MALKLLLGRKVRRAFFKFAVVSSSLFEQRDLFILFNNVKYLYSSVIN